MIDVRNLALVHHDIPKGVRFDKIRKVGEVGVKSHSQIRIPWVRIARSLLSPILNKAISLNLDYFSADLIDEPNPRHRRNIECFEMD